MVALVRVFVHFLKTFAVEQEQRYEIDSHGRLVAVNTGKMVNTLCDCRNRYDKAVEFGIEPELKISCVKIAIHNVN